MNSFINNFFTVLKKRDSEGTISLCDKEHPIFKAHFPGQPILPGFIHLEIIAELFGEKIKKVKKAKFVKHVEPNSIITYKKIKHKVIATVNNEKVASFIL